VPHQGLPTREGAINGTVKEELQAKGFEPLSSAWKANRLTVNICLQNIRQGTKIQGGKHEKGYKEKRKASTTRTARQQGSKAARQRATNCEQQRQ
jgi:hypothetical protein